MSAPPGPGGAQHKPRRAEEGGELATMGLPTAIVNGFGRWRSVTSLRGGSSVAFSVVGTVSTVRHTGVQVRSRTKSVKSKLGRGCGKMFQHALFCLNLIIVQNFTGVSYGCCAQVAGNWGVLYCTSCCRQIRRFSSLAIPSKSRDAHRIIHL
jgi:hypothetical protein